MNKANVFLLVVVSSLLTYISTATQPGATAGVAQEKWEYGVFTVFHSRRENLNFAGPKFWNVQSYVWSDFGNLTLISIYPDGVDAEGCAKVTVTTPDDKTVVLEKGADGAEIYWPGYKLFQSEKEKLIDSIGEKGWQVFQVERLEFSLISKDKDDEEIKYHIRRRVQ